MKSVVSFKLFLTILAMQMILDADAGEKLSAMKKKTPRSLVVMLDGVRSDALQAAATPFLDKLVNGQWRPEYKTFYSVHARPVIDAPTDSAPNHAAIATGVTAKKNLVSANDLIGKGDYKRYPTYLQRIAERTDENTLFCYLWNEDRFLGVHDRVSRLQCDSDEKNFAEILRVLSSENPPPAILYFIDAPDLGGHRSGFYPYGPLYLAALHQCDRYLEAVFQTVADRSEFANEDWLIVITSDHGGIEGTHGPHGTQLETLPFIAVGRNIPAGYGCGHISNFDCSALVLQHHGFTELPPGLDAGIPDLRTLVDDKSGRPVIHETFDSSGYCGISGAAESGFRLGFRNGALKIAKAEARVKVDTDLLRTNSFSCSFYLNLDNGFTEGMIWQFGDLQLRYCSEKIFLLGKKGGKDVYIGEFFCSKQNWQLAVITADHSGNVTLGWGADDGFFYFASSLADLPAGDNAMIFGQGMIGRIDELLVFDRTVKIQDFSDYYHGLRTGRQYQWQ